MSTSTYTEFNDLSPQKKFAQPRVASSRDKGERINGVTQTLPVRMGDHLGFARLDKPKLAFFDGRKKSLMDDSYCVRQLK